MTVLLKRPLSTAIPVHAVDAAGFARAAATLPPMQRQWLATLGFKGAPDTHALLPGEDGRIAAVWDYATSPLFTEAERAALRLAHHAALVPNEASEADFAALRPHFDDGQIVEIVATIALFGYLNRWNDTMATELEALPARVASELIGERGWEPGKHLGERPAAR